MQSISLRKTVISGICLSFVVIAPPVVHTEKKFKN